MNFLYSHLICRDVSIMYGVIVDPHNDHLQVGVITQVIEHCTGIAEVGLRVPFELIFQAFLSAAINARSEG